MCFLVIIKMEKIFKYSLTGFLRLQKARNQLNLKTDDKQNISVKSFRRNENIQEIDRVQFFIKENAGENLIFVYH